MTNLGFQTLCETVNVGQGKGYDNATLPLKHSIQL